MGSEPRVDVMQFDHGDQLEKLVRLPSQHAILVSHASLKNHMCEVRCAVNGREISPRFTRSKTAAKSARAAVIFLNFFVYFGAQCRLFLEK